MQFIVKNVDASVTLRQLFVLLLIAFGLIAALYLPYLSEGMFVSEEPRRALISRTMMNSGDYLVPMLTNEVYTAKPPFYNWLVCLSAAFFGGIDEFSARFVSVFGLGLLLVSMLVLLRRYLAMPGLLMLAGGICLAPELMSKAQLNEIEIIFTLMVSVSLWLWFCLYDQNKRGLALWFWPCMIVAVSFLTKREPSVVFFYFGVFAFLLYKRNIKEIFSAGHFLSAGVMGLLIGVWLWIMIDRVGLEALIQSSQKEVLERGLEDSVFKYLKHILLYPVELVVASLPYSLLLVPVFFRTVRQRVFDLYGDMAKFSVIVVLVNLPIYLLRGDAAVRYFLPMFPTLLVFCAAVFETGIRAESTFSAVAKRGYQLLSKFVFTACLLVVLVLVAYQVRSSWGDEPQSVLPLGVVWVLILALATMTFLYWRIQLRNRYVGLLWIFVVFGLCYRMVYFDILLPHHLKKLSIDRNVSTFVEQIQSQVGLVEGALGSAPAHVPYDIWFYLPDGALVTEREAQRQQLDLSYVIAFKSDLPPQAKPLVSMNYRGKELVFAAKN